MKSGGQGPDSGPVTVKPLRSTVAPAWIVMMSPMPVSGGSGTSIVVVAAPAPVSVSDFPIVTCSL